MVALWWGQTALEALQPGSDSVRQAWLGQELSEYQRGGVFLPRGANNFISGDCIKQETRLITTRWPRCDWWCHQCFRVWSIAKGWKEAEIIHLFRASKPALEGEGCRQVETGKLLPETRYLNCLCLIRPLMWQKSGGNTAMNSSAYFRYRPSSHGLAHCFIILFIYYLFILALLST